MKKCIQVLMVAFLIVGCVPTAGQDNSNVAHSPTVFSTSAAIVPTMLPTARPRTPVVFLGDGAPDDITAAMYLMLNDNIWLRGIVVTNGETHPKIAISKWRDYIYQYMGWMDVQVVAGCNCAVDPHPNSFPASWRTGADDFWGLSLPKYTGKALNISGADLIIQLANEFPGKLVVLITGPHTDLALALRKDPTLKNKIMKVSIMGGAVEVPGNIHADWAEEKNLVSEWNIWVDPLAAAEVFSSGMRLDILPMDAVPDVLLNRTFSEKVDAINLPGADLMAELWRREFSMFGSEQIYIWDVLAAISIDHPEYFEWAKVPLTVVTTLGPDQGRTVAHKGFSTTIRYARHADQFGVLDGLYIVFPPRG
jgi:pyrimidine-specific ribonucleoside hydrolase